MKKKIKIKTILLYAMVLSFFTQNNFIIAQSTNPNFWAKNGNSVLGAGNTFGTFYAGPINIFTNSTQRMFIADGAGIGSGFIGIGNGFTTPTSRLHLRDATGPVRARLLTSAILTNYLLLSLFHQCFYPVAPGVFAIF
ncbi:MAG: hypothetical protein ABR968_00615 [Bacteroidales bacterium]|jgi:hypothetical protein